MRWAHSSCAYHNIAQNREAQQLVSSETFAAIANSLNLLQVLHAAMPIVCHTSPDTICQYHQACHKSLHSRNLESWIHLLSHFHVPRAICHSDRRYADLEVWISRQKRTLMCCGLPSLSRHLLLQAWRLALWHVSVQAIAQRLSLLG